MGKVPPKGWKPPMVPSSGKPCYDCTRLGEPCHRTGHGKDDSVRQVDKGWQAPRTMKVVATLEEAGPWDEVEGRCNGVKPDRTGLCRSFAGTQTPHKGTGRCARHGGSTPSHVLHAQKNAAMAACTKFGLRVEVGPFQALLDLVAETRGDLEFYRAQVQAYEPAAMVWGVSQHRAGSGPEGPIDVTTEIAGPMTWLKLYHEAQARHRAVCVDAIKCGLAERLVREYEETGMRLATAMRALLEALGKDKDATALEAARKALLDAEHVVVDVTPGGA